MSGNVSANMLMFIRPNIRQRVTPKSFTPRVAPTDIFCFKIVTFIPQPRGETVGGFEPLPQVASFTQLFLSHFT